MRPRRGHLRLGSLLPLVLALSCAPTPEVRVEKFTIQGGGVTLVGDLYRPRRAVSDRAILFLHGSSPLGRQLTLYPALCERLCRAGYPVLNMDQRGHGDSTGARVVRSLADLDYVGDAVRAAESLVGPANLGGVKRVIVMGHSFGGGVAVAAGLRSDLVSGVVSISPGRRLAQRFMTPDGLAYVQQRKTRDMKLADPMPLELVKPMLETYDVARIRGTRLPKPLLMVEGSREPDADLAFTRELLASCSGPVTHRVVADSEHYFGAQQVASTDGQRWHIAHTNLLDALASEIVSWLADSGSPSP